MLSCDQKNRPPGGFLFDASRIGSGKPKNCLKAQAAGADIA
jgi:hypothetical protein